MANRKPIKLIYWKIPGRASLAHVLLEAGGVPNVYDDGPAKNETYKQIAPFGQIVMLIDEENKVEMAQSAAVAIYCAKVAHLDGADDIQEYARFLMYVELEQELTQFVGQALYTGVKGSSENSAAWSKAKEKIDIKLRHVERHLDNKKFINGKNLTGSDLAIASIFWLLSLKTLFPNLANDFPLLASHFANVKSACPKAAAAFEKMATWDSYYVNPEVNKA